MPGSTFKIFLIALLSASLGQPARAGIPVIDAANLVQSIQEVINSITQIQNQVEQLTQLRSQLQNMTGSRGLGTVMNNPALQNYIPRDAHTVMGAVETHGYSGLTGTARAMRDASMVYNCTDLAGSERTSCQATLAQPYQHKAYMQQALQSTANRVNQINALLNQVNATTDQKGVQEIQARIQGENALLQHELSRLQAAQHLAEANKDVEASQVVERRLANLSRTNRSWD
jgi:type IV secretion system protein VirB5